MIYLAKEWDLDGSVFLPDSTTLVLECRDSGNLTSTVPVTFYIEDVNDHIPTYNYTLPEGQSGLVFDVSLLIQCIG